MQGDSVSLLVFAERQRRSGRNVQRSLSYTAGAPVPADGASGTEALTRTYSGVRRESSQPSPGGLATRG